jgi:sigma-E factor negative regulatory protein RseC
MDETGRVVAAGDGRVEVEIVPGDSCRTCGASGFCNWTGDRHRMVSARNDAGAKPGDRVVVRTADAGRYRSAALVFGIPAGAMVVGIVAGTLAGRDTGAAIGAGAGLAVGLGVLKLLDRAAARSGESLPTAVEIVRNDDSGSCKGGDDEKTGTDDGGTGGDDGLR